MREYTQNSTFYTDDFNDREFFLTPTEMGMCYVHGGKLADYITLSFVFQPITYPRYTST